MNYKVILNLGKGSIIKGFDNIILSIAKEPNNQPIYQWIIDN